MTRVLVLGADGFVGRRVVRAIARTERMTPIAAGRRAMIASDVERRMCDATDPGSLVHALDGIDAVVNCVTGDAATIVGNAEAVAATLGRRRLVHLSSMAVYGAATGIVDEDAPVSGDTGAYAAAKLAAERRLAAAGNRVVTLRPGCIYGPDSPQWTIRIADLLVERRIGDLGAAGDGCSNLVEVDDVAAAVVAALDRHVAGGTFNLAMPDAPDWNGYFLAMARAIGAVPIRRIPGWRLRVETRLVAPPLKLAERATTRLPSAIPPSLARLWSQDIRLSSARASSLLAIPWTSLDDGIARSTARYAGRRRIIA